MNKFDKDFLLDPKFEFAEFHCTVCGRLTDSEFVDACSSVCHTLWNFWCDQMIDVPNDEIPHPLPFLLSVLKKNLALVERR